MALRQVGQEGCLVFRKRCWNDWINVRFKWIIKYIIPHNVHAEIAWSATLENDELVYTLRMIRDINAFVSAPNRKDAGIGQTSTLHCSAAIGSLSQTLLVIRDDSASTEMLPAPSPLQPLGSTVGHSGLLHSYILSVFDLHHVPRLSAKYSVGRTYQAQRRVHSEVTLPPTRDSCKK